MIKLIVQMSWKFPIFCWTLFVVNGNKFELEESQVFIYYDDSVNTFSVPDCLGTLISANYVLTGASCFINPISNVDFFHYDYVKNAVVLRVTTLIILI